jgi:hypothetical protein
VNLGQVQARVTGTCDPGSAIRVIDGSGAVGCQPDTNSGGTVTSVSSGLGLLGGPITGDGTLSVDTDAIQARVTGGCPAGSAVAAVNPNGTVSCQPLWALGGNAGTTPGTHFLGTTDNVALEVMVNSRRAWRVEPGPGVPPAPNLIGGFRGNSVTAGVAGATIAGGGVDGTTLGLCGGLDTPCPNRVTDYFGTVGGGIDNQAGDGAGTIADRTSATVGGGVSNKATGARATVGGGRSNTASGHGATVPGGLVNQAGGDSSFAAGNQAKVRNAAQSGDSNGDEGTFVWADDQGADFVSTGPNQFLIRAAGGIGINTNAPRGEIQLGTASDFTAFRFGNAGARNHLISNRDMVFNAYGPPEGVAFFWRRNTAQFDETAFVELMTLTGAGNLNVVGTLTKGAGSFKIDHPLDPLHRYLSHSFVESPDMKNIYDGVVTTDREGFATVELPAWFEALNRDFRYQLTVIGGGAWARTRIVQEIRDNRFVVQTDLPETRVSWQVTGIRHDPYARWRPIVVEETKPAEAQGRYLHPDAYGVRP